MKTAWKIRNTALSHYEMYPHPYYIDAINLYHNDIRNKHIDEYALMCLLMLITNFE